jgi:hypothetical protein
MAVHAISGTLTASTVDALTLTSWQPFIVVSLTTTTAGEASITVDGSTPTLGGADTTTVQVPVGTVTVALKNLLPRPDLTTSTPLATDPSAVPVFSTSQTKVNLIANQAMSFSVELSSNPGVPVLA